MNSSTTPIDNHAENNTTTTVQPPTAQNSGFEGMLPKVAGGAPARIYLNANITPYLLEGLKDIVRDQPSNPLKVLGEYLIKKSDEIEQKQNE